MKKPIKATAIVQKFLKTTALSTAVTLAMTSLAYANSDYKKIGDLEIYQAAKAGPNLAMMLDTSGSMWTVDFPDGYSNYPMLDNKNWRACEKYGYKYHDKTYTRTFDTSIGKKTVRLSGCLDEKNNKFYGDRISILRESLIEVLITPGELSDHTKIALGQFSGNKSKMLTPMMQLTKENRMELIDIIDFIGAGGATPTSFAYANVGAFMMGTSPGSSVFSGFRDSDRKTKNGTVYKKGASEITCEGNGIYLMSDGHPYNPIEIAKLTDNERQTVRADGYDLGQDNADSRYYKSPNYFDINRATRAFINNSFGANHPLRITENSCKNGQLIGDNTAEVFQGWACMSIYAKLLRDTRNPSGREILTATVGFGREFQGLPKSEEIREDSEGKKRTVTVYDCDGGANDLSINIRNMCKLGDDRKNGYQYGRGGFTHAMVGADIKKSVVEFIKTLNQTLNLSPSGTVSIPKDPMNIDAIQPYAYLPMVQPEVAKNYNTWEGNLKKYHTLFGTLYGKNNRPLYTTNPKATSTNQNIHFDFNKSTTDLWQIGETLDNRALSAGGARNRLPIPKANSKANIRTVYVETTINGQSKLVKVGTNGTNLIGFDQLGSEYTMVDRAYILNYLGFAVSTNESTYNGRTLAANL